MGFGQDNRVNSELDYYAILGLTPKATAAEIKKSYIRLARERHPDKLPSELRNDVNAKQLYIDTKDAYEILKDPDTRREYDSNAHRRTPGVTSQSASPSQQPSMPQPWDHPTAERPHTPQSSTRDRWEEDPKRCAGMANAKIMSEIELAALGKDLKKLIALLPQYKSMLQMWRTHLTEYDNEPNLKDLNWLLRNAAMTKANDIAVTLIEFGADVNHYGDISSKDGSDIFECYFVDVLMYYDNFDLFEKIHKSLNLKVYFVSENHIVETKPEHHRWHKDFDALYPITRLLMFAMFCDWLVKHNYYAKRKEIGQAPGLNALDYVSWRNDTRNICYNANHCYSSIYVLQQFDLATEQGSNVRRRFARQHLIDMFSFINLIAGDYIPRLDEMSKQFSILLETKHDPMVADVYRINRMLFCGQNRTKPILGIAAFGAALVMLSMFLIAEHNDYYLLPFVLGVLLIFSPLTLCTTSLAIGFILLLTRELSCRMFDVYTIPGEILLSAYTNILLKDIAQNIHNPQQQSHNHQQNQHKPGLFFNSNNTPSAKPEPIKEDDIENQNPKTGNLSLAL